MLKVYNTLTRKKESFTPVNAGKVGMYNCGPTVYSQSTIGNWRYMVFTDLLRRSLEFLGYEVFQVMNITDVGHLTLTNDQKKQLGSVEITDTDAGLDRMEKTSKLENISVWDVANKYLDLFLKERDSLNILPPTVLPRATEHIAEQIDMIKKLIDKGFAYVSKDAVYFDTAKFPSYGSFSKQNLEDKLVKARQEVEYDKNKKNQADFRLWQLNQPNHSMQWESPWGKGYPGWHIECSAMSLKYLKQPIDIHTGGVDHISVHHPNEIAQSEASTGNKFVNFWIHSEFLKIDGRRIGKSLGNAYNLTDLNNNGFSPLDLRFFFLTAHYRQSQNFTWKSLESAKIRRKDIQNFITNAESSNAKRKESLLKTDKFLLDFSQAIQNDLNFPLSLAVISKLLSSSYSDYQKLLVLKEFNKVLGVFSFNSQIASNSIEIKELIAKRNKFRDQKQWNKADEVRMLLLKNYSVVLEDSEEGTKWYYIDNESK